MDLKNLFVNIISFVLICVGCILLYKFRRSEVVEVRILNDVKANLTLIENNVSPALNLSKNETSTWGYVFINDPVGGLGDRLRAAILGYYIALLTNRSLKVDGTRVWKDDQCSHFCSNNVNWKASKEEKELLTSQNVTRVSLTFYLKNGELVGDQIDFEKLKKVEVISLKTNSLNLKLLGDNLILKESPKFQFFNELHQKGLLSQHALRSLFKPGKNVQSHLEALQREYWPTNNTFRIGMHIRTGDNARLTSNTKRKFHDQRVVQFERTKCFASKAISIWEGKQKEEKINGSVIFFISSDLIDHEEAIIQIIESKGYRIFRNNNLGEAKHIAKTSVDQIRTFVDWWTLVNMDVILLPVSGFSEFASKYSCTPSYLFFETGGSDCDKLFTPYIGNGFCQKEFDETHLQKTKAVPIYNK